MSIFPKNESLDRFFAVRLDGPSGVREERNWIVEMRRCEAGDGVEEGEKGDGSSGSDWLLPEALILTRVSLIANMKM